VTPDAIQLAVEWHPEAVKIARMSRTWLPRQDAESVAGEAVCEAAQLWVDQNLSGSFSGWLRRIVRRRLVDETRRQLGRRGQRPRPQTLEQPVGDNGLTLADVLADPDDPYSRIDDQAWAERVRRAVELRLTPRRREAALLYGSGLTMAETADRMGVSEPAVCHAIREVREALADLQGP
jgi:RNA polymerase sigma factor (sigma-70 family)